MFKFDWYTLSNVDGFLPVLISEWFTVSHVGRVCPTQMDTPTTKIFLGDDISTNWRFDSPTVIIMPA